jgi:hypothetical protein
VPVENPEPEKAATEPAQEKEMPARAELPPGVAGTAEKPSGVLLRFNNDRREWDQIVDATPLKSADRLLGLDPFRSTLAFGGARVDLVGETELLLGVAPPNEAARLRLAQGRLVLHGADSPLPFEIPFGDKSLLITPAAGAIVGVERAGRFEPGVPESAGTVLRVYSTEGDVALEADDTKGEDLKETLSGPGLIVWDGSKWTDKSDKPPPAWVTESKPTAYEQQIGEQFLRYMRPNRPVITNIVEAHDDDQKDVRRLSLRALRAVGDLSYVTPDLNKPDDPTARREAIRVLRASLAQGGDSAKAVHDQLERDFGAAQAGILEKLLIGFNTKEARDPATYDGLVQKLSAPDVGVRELALDNLRSLTGRDDLQYDPDKFEGPGLNAWRQLNRDHELRPPAPLAKP